MPFLLDLSLHYPSVGNGGLLILLSPGKLSLTSVTFDNSVIDVFLFNVFTFVSRMLKIFF